MNWFLILAPITALAFSWLFMPTIIKLAVKKHLFDVPDARKTHKVPIPSLGGIGIFIGFWVATFLFTGADFFVQLKFIVVSGFLLFMIGIGDDLLDIRASKKFIYQLLIASFLYIGGFQLQGFYGLFGLEELPIYLNFPLTLLAIALIINAYNLIDGVNGLAGSLSTLGALTFGFLFLNNNMPNWAIVAFSVAGTTIGFLRFNMGNAKIFMGDNGSTFLGLMMSLFFIKYLDSAYYIQGETHALAIGMSIIIVPVLDLLRVFTLRIKRGDSPFTADRIHLHHLVSRLGKSHLKITFALVALNITIIVTALFFLADSTLLISILGIITIFFMAVLFLWTSEGFTQMKSKERNGFVMPLKALYGGDY